MTWLFNATIKWLYFEQYGSWCMIKEWLLCNDMDNIDIAFSSDYEMTKIWGTNWKLTTKQLMYFDIIMLNTYLPNYLLTYIFTYPPIHLLTYPPPTYLPTHSPTYLFFTSPTYLLPTILQLAYSYYLQHSLVMIWNKHVN